MIVQSEGRVNGCPEGDAIRDGELKLDASKAFDCARRMQLLPTIYTKNGK